MSSKPEIPSVVDELRAAAGKGARLALDTKVVGLEPILNEFRCGDPTGQAQPRAITVHIARARGRLLATVRTPQMPNSYVPGPDEFTPARGEAPTLDTPRADGWLRGVCKGVRASRAVARARMLVLIEASAVLSETVRLRATLGALARDVNATVVVVTDYPGFHPRGKIEAQLMPAFGEPVAADFEDHSPTDEWDDFVTGTTRGEAS